ncbi:MAG: hypothetical protein DIZ80_16620 [endosymbiont of Galathealinum brachiosum]|uniref:Uncharacterized protein n=1 Tax=endosymbiont of Galathealinum brachiosum TaxID=2200906 RepID=A0A370D8Y6_9GAMM|nr:MAG: hypothetical protein DIZ80_16620 [endosymbiont of Galathealinum brachiosum]
MSIRLLGRMGAVLAALAILTLQGCATSADKTRGMRQMMELNRNDLALIEAEKHLASEVEGVMENMNVGLLRRLNKDYKGSNEAFELAKEKISELYTTSISQQAGAAVTNDESIDFQGYKFEQVLVHLYMAANYLSMGDIDSSRVELLQSQVKMDEWGEPKDETPFMRYFSGIMFEMLGEEDTATVSYRKAVDAYRNTKEKHGLNVPKTLKHDLLRMLARMKLWGEYKDYKKQFGLSKYKAPKTKGKGELVVVFGNGLAPQREEKVFQTFSSALALNIKVAVPDYPNPPVVLNKVRLNIDGKYYPLEIVSNIDGLARAALAEDMPIITTRAIARAVIKKKAEEEAGNQGGFLGQLAMMAVNQGTEIADTRCWNTLPQEFKLARVFLPQGKHKVLIEVVGPTGAVVDTITRNVSIKAGAKSVVSKRWTAPEPKAVPMQPVGGQAAAPAATPAT